MLTNTYKQQKLSAKFYKNGYWSLTGQFTAIRGFFLVILVQNVSPLIPSKRSSKPISHFSDWTWQWAPVLCSSRESKICAWKIWISQGGIEGGAGEHIAQDRCYSLCVWCTRACFTCQSGTILKLLILWSAFVKFPLDWPGVERGAGRPITKAWTEISWDWGGQWTFEL